MKPVLLLQRLMNRLLAREDGQDLAEYALLVGFVAFVVIAGVSLFGTSLLAFYSRLAEGIRAALGV